MVKKIKSLFLAAAFMTTLIPNCATAASSDSILDTNFNDNKISGWQLEVCGESKGSVKVKNKELMVNVEKKGVNKWDLALKHSITPLEIGGTYKVEFYVYSDKQESIYAKIGDCNDPYREYWNNNWSPIEINKYKKSISQTFTVTNSSDAEEMAFHLGGELKGLVPCKIYFDDIKIIKLSSKNDVLKYDFNDNKIGDWKLDVVGDAKASTYVRNGQLKAQVFSKGTNRWDIALKHAITPLEIGATYKVDFKLSAKKDTSVYAKIGDTLDPYKEYWNNNWSPIKLTANTPVAISQTFVVTGRSDQEEMAFHLGGDLCLSKYCEISFDDISITKIPRTIPTPTPTPTNPPTPTTTPKDPLDILYYNFNDDSIGNWVLDATNGAAASYKVENGEMKLHVDAAGESPWDVALYHKIPSLKAGSTYKVQFAIKASNDAKVYPKIGDVGEPFREVWHPQDWMALNISGNRLLVVSELFVPNATCPDELIAFHFGGSNSLILPNDFILDDISIREVEPVLTPTSTSTPTPTTTPTQPTDILNCNFDNGDITGWNIDTNNGGEAGYKVAGGALQVNVQAPGIEQWDVALTHKIPSLIAGTAYKVEFKIKASKQSMVYAKIGDVAEPYGEVWNNNWSPISLPPNQTLTIVQTFVPSVTCPDEHLAFFFGGRNANVEPNDIVLDDIKISRVIATSIPTPTPTPTAPAGVINYNFNDGSKGEWILDTANGAVATNTVENGEMKVQVNAAGENQWDISLYHKLPAFKVGKMYDIKFKMRASKDAKVYVKVGDIGDPFREMWNNSWTPYSLTADQNVTISSLIIPTYDSADQLVAFHIGGRLAGEVPYNLYFDDIQITEK